MSQAARWLAKVSLTLAGGLVAAGCGGSGGSSSNDASLDATVGPGDADQGADAATCAALPCLAHATGLIASCAPSGTCIEQVTASGSTSTQAKCFSAGVKILVTGMTLASGGTSTVMTVWKNGAICYSFAATEESASVGTIVYKDGAGTELVTETASGATLTVACPGGLAIVPDSSCDAALYALQGLYPFTNATSCTSGTCAP